MKYKEKEYVPKKLKMSICRTILDMYRISYWKYLNYFLFIFSFGEISPAPFPAIRIRFKCLFRSPFPAAGQDFAPLRNGHFLPGQQGKATRHPQVERPQRIGQARRTHQQDVRFISEFVFTTFFAKREIISIFFKQTGKMSTFGISDLSTARTSM